jgi:hypothetical protein
MEFVYSEVSVYCWRMKVSRIGLCKKRYIIESTVCISCRLCKHRVLVSVKKRQKKFTLRLYCVNRDVLLTTTFQIWNNGKVSNYGQIIIANCQ